MVRVILGVAIGGAIGGLLGWKGLCEGGACPLASNPYITGGLGAMFGGLLLTGSPGPTPATIESDQPAADDPKGADAGVDEVPGRETES